MITRDLFLYEILPRVNRSDFITSIKALYYLVLGGKQVVQQLYAVKHTNLISYNSFEIECRNFQDGRLLCSATTTHKSHMVPIVGVSPDAKHITYYFNNNLITINKDGKCFSDLRNKIVFSPSGKWFASWYGVPKFKSEGNMYIGEEQRLYVGITDPYTQKTLKGILFAPAMCCFSHDDQYLAIENLNGITVYHTETLTEIQSFRFSFVSAKHLMYSPDGKYLFLAERGEMIYLINVLTKMIYTIPSKQYGTPYCFSPDSRYLAFGGDRCFITIYDVQQHCFVRQLNTSQPQAKYLCFSPDGSFLLSSGLKSGTIVFWDTCNWQQVDFIETKANEKIYHTQANDKFFFTQGDPPSVLFQLLQQKE